MSEQPSNPPTSCSCVPLNRDLFLRTLLGELAGTLQDVVGLDAASGYISVVGQRMGEQILEMYDSESAGSKRTPREVGNLLADLKQRIHGDFHVVDLDDEKIVLESGTCPFGKMVEGRPALCMMTSNVFGVIASDQLGYAKVSIEQSIARGDEGCRVVVRHERSNDARAAGGREYFGV